MGKETATQVKEGQSPSQDKPKEKHAETHSNQTDKNYRQSKIIKSEKGTTTNNIQGNFHKLTADFSAETLQARREWHDILKVMKGKNLQPRLLYPARIPFRFNGEVKSFTDKQS